jgi:hypothetical protein
MEVSMKRTAMAEQMAREIAEAREALLECARREPDRWWFAYELKDFARNGWSAGAMNMALRRLIKTGAFETEGDRIRLQR